MPKRGRGPKLTRGQRNTNKYETKTHFGPSFTGRKPKQTQTNHTGTVHLGPGSSALGVTQPIKGKKGIVGIHSQPVKSGSGRRTTMVDMEDHAEGSGEKQVNEEQSTFRFPIMDPDTQVQMKNISPSALPHFYGKVHEDPNSFLFDFDILCRSYDYSFDA